MQAALAEPGQSSDLDRPSRQRSLRYGACFLLKRHPHVYRKCPLMCKSDALYSLLGCCVRTLARNLPAQAVSHSPVFVTGVNETSA